MNKLRFISNMLVTAQILLIAGASVACWFTVTLEDGVFVPVSDPHLRITSKHVKDTLYQSLFDVRPPVKGDPVLTTIERAEISMRVDNSLKAVIMAKIVLVAGWILLVLELFRRIIRSVEGQSSFSAQNIRRVKLAGLFIMLLPVFDWVLREGSVLWIESRLKFEGLRLVSVADYGILTAIFGLLIIVLGVAFDQAQKLQEENELTI